MASLNSLNLRGAECSFLEVALVDVRRYVDLENKKQVLVFPPFSARNRFLVHTLVQNFFHQLNTISIGSSFGRRIVVHHSSLTPMFHGTELEKSNEVVNKNNLSMQRAYRTPSERKAQDKLFQSLMPKKKVDKSLRSTQRKRPDIPIYVPKALRGSAISTVPNSCATNSSPSKSKYSSIIPNNSSCKQGSKEGKGSLSALHLNNQPKHCILSSLNSFKFIDLTSEMLPDNINNEYKTPLDEISCQIPGLSGNFPDFLNTNERNPDSSSSNKTVDTKISISEPQSMGTTLDNCDSISTISDFSICLSDNNNSNSTSINSSDLTQIEKLGTAAENLPESREIRKSILNVDIAGITVDEKITNVSNSQRGKVHLANSSVDSNRSEMKFITEHITNGLRYCLDDSVNSEPLMDVKKKYFNGELESSQSSKLVDKSTETIGNDEQEVQKKKVLDVDECSWEDLYDKDDDYIHPLLMKELVSSIGKVQVQCAKEDYRVHQTIEERSGDGECVIEVYGFSSELKTIDLMNQFAEFRKKHFEIVWVDDTHALAVFESPNLADRALNTPFALVKTRPLKNAIKESKLKAETVAPLPVTRPKTCTLMARRLVSSALGLKMNISPDLMNAERTLLANAKNRKIQDAQQKHNIWNSES